MGYLLYADALGIQALLARDPGRAAKVLQQIADIAKFCADRHMPGTSTRIRQSPGGRLVVFNDSIFYYSPTLPEVIQFASQLAYNLFVNPANKGGTVAIRGSVIRTETHPRIKVERDGTFFNASRLIVDQLGGALIADKRRVLGARIIVPRDIIDASYATWDCRLQAKVVHLAELHPPADILRLEEGLERYCDVLWMNIESKGRFSTLRPLLDEFVYQAAFGQRSALHAAATLALYRATDSRRRQIVVILRKLWAGVAKQIAGARVTPAKDDYSGWMGMAQKIREVRGGELAFPLNIAKRAPI